MLTSVQYHVMQHFSSVVDRYQAWLWACSLELPRHCVLTTSSTPASWSATTLRKEMPISPSLLLLLARSLMSHRWVGPPLFSNAISDESPEIEKMMISFKPELLLHIAVNDNVTYLVSTTTKRTIKQSPSSTDSSAIIWLVRGKQ